MELASTLITKYRKTSGISQSELAELLSNIGYPTTNKMISSWEKNTSVPNANQFLGICEVLRIHDAELSDLNDLGIAKVRDYINTLSLIDRYRNNKTRTVPLYDQSVSAGVGEYHEDTSLAEITVPEGIKEIINYAVKVSGDSMKPRYRDGDIVFVRVTNNLRVGDIGIFNVNGEAFIKVLGVGELISLNNEYPPIQIGEYDNFRIQGKVVY